MQFQEFLIGLLNKDQESEFSTFQLVAACGTKHTRR